MENRPKGIYHLLVCLPDHLYPFACEIEGKWVRGVRSYDRALAAAFEKHGPGHYGAWLVLYRSIFHVVGSIAIIVAAALISNDVFGSKIALYVVLVLTAVFIAFQEFYLQRKSYEQLWRKAAVDYLGWVIPICVYIFLR